MVKEDLIERNAAALEAATRVRQEKKIVQKYHLEQIKKTRERALKEVDLKISEKLELLKLYFRLKNGKPKAERSKRTNWNGKKS